MNGLNRERIKYLVQESCLFLGLSYLVLLGGTYNGLVLYSLNLINLILFSGFGFLWIVSRIIKKRSFPRTGLDLGLALFLGAAAISTIYSVDPRRSLIALIILVITVMLYYFTVDIIRQGIPIQLINKVLILVSCFILFFGIREIILWYSGWIKISGFSDLIPPVTYRIRAFLGNPNFVAAYLNLLIPLGIVMVIKNKQLSAKLLLGLWLLMALTLVFLTSSRGGWLGTFFALGTFFLFWGITKREEIKINIRKLFKKKWMFAGIALIAIIGLVSLVIIVRWQLNLRTTPTDWSNIFNRTPFWAFALDMFRGRPLTGNGLFTFGSEFLNIFSTPPGDARNHAHSYYLNVGSEMGILGIIGLLIYIGSLFLVARKSWITHNELDQIEMAGLFGSLMGFGIHSFVDTPQMMPLLMILPVILIAQLTSGINNVKEKTHPWLGNLTLLGLLLIASAGMGFDVRALSFFNKGIEASNNENWSIAGEFVSQASLMDPKNAFYVFQDGFISGKISLDSSGGVVNRAELNEGILAYQKGLGIEPAYSVNWMNLGLLQWAAGDQDQAVESVIIAAEKAPEQAAFYLTLGKMLETIGKEQEAKEAYIKALTINTFWSEEIYFRKSTLRQRALSEWKIRNNNMENEQNEFLQDGWNLIFREQHDEALEVFLQTPRFNNPETYLAIGKTYFLLGENHQAEKYLQTALWMGSSDGWLITKINLNLGDLAVLEEDCQSAIEYYSRAITLLDRTTSYGIGTLGTSQYSWYLFNKPSIALDLLPGMENIIYTNEVIEGMYNLGACYLESEQAELAKAVYQKILVQRPGDSVATLKLAEIKSE